uniref:VWFC domain-containing protein n=1 Tax=Megaselia scalaris TaxID=36166 RepID=T1GF36_MEGSC
PLQESTDLQEYSEGCYYNYNHYNEGDRISTNEPCLNCTCHNKMLMCYLRVCPFTKPIGHDCVVEKREDQCCPIITCPEVPVELNHQSDLSTELAIPEIPSNPNKPCELCYCIKNQTSCLMQECTLHIDGCQPIYNKNSCCPVRYNCDHENELIEDLSTTTTTVRPTTGFMLTTVSSLTSADCYHDDKTYPDGSLIKTSDSCENCYCMRGDIVCAVQKCEVPTMEVEGKVCKAGEKLEGECCPSNYICEDIDRNDPEKIHKISQEDVELQQHIDEENVYTTEEKDDDAKDKEDSINIDETTVSTSEENYVTETTISSIDSNKDILTNESQENKTKTESNLIFNTDSPDQIKDDTLEDIEDIPISIPGEGNCLVDDETYSNNTRVPTSNECEEYCLYNTNKLECCPVYICDSNNTQYLPPKEDNLLHNVDSTEKSVDENIEITTLSEDHLPTSASDVLEIEKTTHKSLEVSSTESHLVDEKLESSTDISDISSSEKIENDFESSGSGEIYTTTTKSSIYEEHAKETENTSEEKENVPE